MKPKKPRLLFAVALGSSIAAGVVAASAWGVGGHRSDAGSVRDRVLAAAPQAAGALTGASETIFSRAKGDQGDLEVMASTGSNRCLIIDEKNAACFDTKGATLGTGGTIAFSADGTATVSGYAPSGIDRVRVTVGRQSTLVPARGGYYLGQIHIQVTRSPEGFPSIPHVQVTAG
jgi:hypothetical protein